MVYALQPTIAGHQELSDETPSTSGHDRHYRNRETEQFKWTTEGRPSEVAAFDDFSSGLHFTPSENFTELDVFQHFMDNDFMSFIVEMTNKFHNNFLLKVDLRMHSRLHRWYDVTVPEMQCFLTIMMLMTRNRHLTIEEHWSTDILLNAPIFSKLMSRNRFCMILGMLHFSRPNEENSILSKIEACVAHARGKFKSIITPYRDVCIDESIVPFKGRLTIKQYLPKKRNRFGVKLFVLCDVHSGLIIDFIVYCGAATDIDDPANLGVGGAVVSSLLKDFFGSNRHLYVDNWYTSPLLFKYLYDNNIYACGTVKQNRKCMANLSRKLNLHEMETQYSGSLMACKWRDKKYIYMLSTIHDNSMEPSARINRGTGLPVMKPKAVLDYSKNMGSVDTADMLLPSLQCIRKTVKSYKKLFFHIFDMHLLNAFFCFKMIKGIPNLAFADFQLSLIRQMIDCYNTGNVLERPIRTGRGFNNPLSILPGNAKDHMPSRIAKHQRCKFCAIKKKRKETRYWCKICNVYLCAAPCFEKYHNK